VQVGYDDTVFSPDDAPSDTLRRQRAYAAELARLRADAHLTYCVLTTRIDVRERREDHLTILPIAARGLRRSQSRLYGALAALHRRQPISALATQTAFADGACGVLFGQRHGIPVVVQLHHHLVLAAESALRRRIAEYALSGATVVRTVNAAAARSLVQRGVARRAVNIPVAVTLARSAAPAVHDNAAAANETVLFVGSLLPVKGVHTWCRVAAAIAAHRPATRFVVAGDGPLRSEIERAAHDGPLSGRVTLLGRVPHAQLSNLYAQASVLLMTSRSEGFGRVAVEAHRHGVPVVGTNVGGLSDIVEEGRTGYLRAPDDVDGLAAAVEQILERPDCRSAMSAEAMRVADDRFDPARLTREWVSLLIETAERTERLQPPRVPSLKRWRLLRTRQYSMLRALQYERFREVPLEGRVLDVGGGARADYTPLLNGRQVDSVNIDPSMRPTFVADLNVAIPVRDSVYDTVISLNTLEHVEHDTVAISEMIRVLRPGARLHILVPFLYRVHADPHDYHRHTWHWWSSHLAAAGLDSGSIGIEPLVWDRVGSGFSLVEFAPGLRVLKGGAMLPGLLRAWLGVWRPRSDFALGYYITGRKRIVAT
jgi:glycosyltransferase involved in cell wall biosynthesis